MFLPACVSRCSCLCVTVFLSVSDRVLVYRRDAGPQVKKLTNNNSIIKFFACIGEVASHTRRLPSNPTAHAPARARAHTLYAIDE